MILILLVVAPVKSAEPWYELMEHQHFMDGPPPTHALEPGESGWYLRDWHTSHKEGNCWIIGSSESPWYYYHPWEPRIMTNIGRKSNGNYYVVVNGMKEYAQITPNCQCRFCK